MSVELREHANSVLAYASGVLAEHATPILESAVALAKDYLAAPVPPIDDAEPIGIDWLVKVGGRHRIYASAEFVSFDLLEYSPNRNEVRIGCGSLWLSHIKTRGHFRLLSRALGTPLKEQPDV